MHFDAMDALKLMFLLQFYSLFCSSFGAFKSHHKSHLETQESALTVYDLSSGTSAHVTVSVDSMGLGEGGEEHYLTYLDLKSNQSISTFINWHGADLLCNLDNLGGRQVRRSGIPLFDKIDMADDRIWA